MVAGMELKRNGEGKELDVGIAGIYPGFDTTLRAGVVNRAELGDGVFICDKF